MGISTSCLRSKCNQNHECCDFHSTKPTASVIILIMRINIIMMMMVTKKKKKEMDKMIQ